jgi:hypothetical protein
MPLAGRGRLERTRPYEPQEMNEAEGNLAIPAEYGKADLREPTDLLPAMGYRNMPLCPILVRSPQAD